MPPRPHVFINKRTYSRARIYSYLLLTLFLLATSQSAWTADSWAETYSSARHPLLGTAFCYSTAKDLCRAKPFRKNIKVDNATAQAYGWEIIFAAQAIKQATNISFSATNDGFQPYISFYAWSSRRQTVTSVDSIATAQRFPVGTASYTHGHQRCDMVIRKGRMDALSFNQRVAVLIHEMGHCMGLDHYPKKGGVQEIMYDTLTCGLNNFGMCGVSARFDLAIEEGYFFRPYGYYWWNDDPNWIRWVDQQNGGTYNGSRICGILGLACIDI